MFKYLLFLGITALLIFAQAIPASAQYICQPAANPIVVQGSINNGDVQQAGRITRDGNPSTCTGSESAAVENNTALRRDTHNFANPFNETVCVTVDLDFSGCGGAQTQAAAYSSYNPAFPAQNVIGDMGYSTINKGRFSFSVGPNAPFNIVVNDIEDDNAMCALYKFTVTYQRNCRQLGFDRSNDGKADFTVYRPSSQSFWYTLDSETNSLVGRQFGTVGDIVTGGSDYTGDGRSDLSLYRPSINSWIYGTDQASPGTNFAVQQWGQNGDIRVPGDYDGDSKNDIAIFRPSDGYWHVLRSSDGSIQSQQWGQQNDIPLSGDFDGDMKTDFTIVRQTSGGSHWHVLKSNFNYGFDQFIQWGLPTDKLVPADYDGDAKTDFAVWRPSEGTWYVRRSSDSTLQAAKWGTQGDIPQPADYDGDKLQDFAVWRPSNGTWYVIQSQTGTFRFQQFGQQGDQPIASNMRIQ
ncbi:MAG: hypothetical protein M3384_08650 [Acidobacteriota bacterium]|nr:hypothetical protein [Acidobacteriota bacterium]